MEARAAEQELQFIRRVIERTQRRVDPHAFHFVHWGAIVLVGYPAINACTLSGRDAWVPWIGGAALLLGGILSCVREMALARQPRLPGEDFDLGRRVAWVVAANLIAGAVLSVLLPASGALAGDDVSIVWGLLYANMTVMVGILYDRAFVVAGAVIFAGTLLAILFRSYAGFLLGPFMGLGMILPSLRAERRVRAMRQDTESALGEHGPEPV